RPAGRQPSRPSVHSLLPTRRRACIVTQGDAAVLCLPFRPFNPPDTDLDAIANGKCQGVRFILRTLFRAVDRRDRQRRSNGLRPSPRTTRALEDTWCHTRSWIRSHDGVPRPSAITPTAWK